MGIFDGFKTVKRKWLRELTRIRLKWKPGFWSSTTASMVLDDSIRARHFVLLLSLLLLLLLLFLFTVHKSRVLGSSWDVLHGSLTNPASECIESSILWRECSSLHIQWRRCYARWLNNCAYVYRPLICRSYANILVGGIWNQLLQAVRNATVGYSSVHTFTERWLRLKFTGEYMNMLCIT